MKKNFPSNELFGIIALSFYNAASLFGNVEHSLFCKTFSSFLLSCGLGYVAQEQKIENSLTEYFKTTINPFVSKNPTFFPMNC